ncbi:MAG: hypothetical protein Q8R83_06085 [Legionellaceae bacterium]|nr:hypothetical protein [Legionellaceae bacterium]
MVDHYIHTLTFKTGGTPSVYNESTGVYTQAIPGEDLTIECRANPSGAGKMVRKEDGAETSYAFDLGFPDETAVLPVANQLVILKGVDKETLWSGPLIRIQRGDLSIRGWL